METNGIVLAGGKSQRFGRDKLWESIGSRTLLERVISRLEFLKGNIIVVKAREQLLPDVSGYAGVVLVEDALPDRGPLGGIHAGLKASRAGYNLVVAGDMPFLSRQLLEYMLSLADGYDLVIPRIDNLVEPLHAVYSKSCLSPIEKLLQKGELRIRHFFDMVKIKYVEKSEIERFDPAHLSLFNVNSGADLEKARELALREKGHD